MPEDSDLLLGEWNRTLDERFRISLPNEVLEGLAGGQRTCTLAKERPGCVSLWNSQRWEAWLAEGVHLLDSKVRAGRLEDRMESVQSLGRLLSTRHRSIPLAGRGRIAIPDSFRAFLAVEPGGDVLVVGAAICVEIWSPLQWADHIGQQMPTFRSLFQELTN
jgi:MraZ protein